MGVVVTDGGAEDANKERSETVGEDGLGERKKEEERWREGEREGGGEGKC